MLCNLFTCYLDLLVICKGTFGNLGLKNRFGKVSYMKYRNAHIKEYFFFFLAVKVPRSLCNKHLTIMLSLNKGSKNDIDNLSPLVYLHSANRSE